ncbi:MAG: hypothetical protein AB9828_11065 [Sphaerochaetaceae bacterium]
MAKTIAEQCIIRPLPGYIVPQTDHIAIIRSDTFRREPLDKLTSLPSC